MAVNFLLLSLPLTLSIVYPDTGSLYALLASITNIFVVYLIPCSLYIKYFQKREIDEYQERVQIIKRNRRNLFDGSMYENSSNDSLIIS